MEKQQVFYIHGGESFENREDFINRLKTAELWHLPKEDEEESKGKWTSHLAEDLGSDFEVIMPPMPNKQNARFDEWSIWFERHFEYVKGSPILIGCSLGAMFLAKYLTHNNLQFRPKAVFLIAGAYNIPGFDDAVSCRDFLVDTDSIKTVADKTDKLVIIHSKDDFVVPYEHGLALSASIPEAEFITFEDKNHFLIEEFPELLEMVKSV